MEVEIRRKTEVVSQNYALTTKNEFHLLNILNIFLHNVAHN